MFIFQLRIYWEDTDAGGIVYYANYLRFLERARSEWLRARGVSQRVLAAQDAVVFSVVGLEVQYRRPARLDDLIAVSCEPTQCGGASFACEQNIWRSSEAGELLLHATVRIACLDVQSLKPRRLPQVIVEDVLKE